MEEGPDLRAYWRIFQRRWWLLVLGVVVGAAVGFLAVSMTTPLYRATTKILVQGGVTPGTPSLSDIEASRRLSQNYGDLIKTRPILELVAQTLSIEATYSPGTLFSIIKVSSPRSLIEITVTDPDPKRAADIANTTANVFIDDFRDKQFLQIAQFQSSLGQYGIAQEPSIISAQAATMSALRVAESAVPPSSPSSPRRLATVALATGLGFMLGMTAIFTLELLDDRVKSPVELKSLTGLTTLGSVLRYRRQDGMQPFLVSDESADRGIFEWYKFLRTNLQFAALNTNGFKALMVTSSNPGEGKTTTATNLATSIAGDGKSVILVDTDLRKPTMHRTFDLPEHKGLTHLILGEATLEEVLAPTHIEGLRVVTSGPVPPDATYILGSLKMRELVDQLKNAADMVIFDSSPLLAVADSMLLATLVDCVLLVVDSERTSREAVKRSVESLQQAHPAFVGAVMNKVSTKGSSGYYNYYQHHYYYSADGGKQRRQNGRRHRLLPNLFRRREHSRVGSELRDGR